MRLIRESRIDGEFFGYLGGRVYQLDKERTCIVAYGHP